MTARRMSLFLFRQTVPARVARKHPIPPPSVAAVAGTRPDGSHASPAARRPLSKWNPPAEVFSPSPRGNISISAARELRDFYIFFFPLAHTHTYTHTHFSPPHALRTVIFSHYGNGTRGQKSLISPVVTTSGTGRAADNVRGQSTLVKPVGRD